MIGIDKLIAQPEYPIIKSIKSVNNDIAIVWINTFEAILTFLLIEYITVTHEYIIPKITIKHHKKFGVVHMFTITQIKATTNDTIIIVFIAIFPFFTFLTLGYKVMHTIPFYIYINSFFF